MLFWESLFKQSSSSAYFYSPFFFPPPEKEGRHTRPLCGKCERALSPFLFFVLCICVYIRILNNNNNNNKCCSPNRHLLVSCAPIYGHNMPLTYNDIKETRKCHRYKWLSLHLVMGKLKIKKFDCHKHYIVISGIVYCTVYLHFSTHAHTGGLPDSFYFRTSFCITFILSLYLYFCLYLNKPLNKNLWAFVSVDHTRCKLMKSSSFNFQYRFGLAVAVLVLSHSAVKIFPCQLSWITHNMHISPWGFRGAYVLTAYLSLLQGHTWRLTFPNKNALQQ